jgi:membrane protein implicated in regulation of membrane protease activity
MKKISLGSIGLDEIVYLLWFTITVAVAACLFMTVFMLFLMGMGIIAETFIPKDFLPRQEIRVVIIYLFLALNILLRYPRRKASQQNLDTKPSRYKGRQNLLKNKKT